MAESPKEAICRYLEDAIAAEKSFETQLESFSREGDDPQVKALFAQHARETRAQWEQLTRRLEALGGSPSLAKSFMSHLFGMAPKSASLGHEKEERTSQNLMMAYSVENAECAMYEAMATSASVAGDTATESLARSIQQQERQTAEKIWALISSVSRQAFAHVAAAS